MESDSDEDKLLENRDKLTEMILKEKKENPSSFVSHWEADEDVERETEEDRKIIDLDSKEKQFLHAAQNGNNDILKTLIEEKKELVGCRDSDGYTPLHRACYEGRLDTVQLLLANGADVNARTTEGWTPLHSACFWGQVDVAALLTHTKHCLLNATTNGNQTPLHLAAQNSSNLKLFQLLLLNPFINPSILNSTNETAKDIAVRSFKYNELFDITNSDVNVM